MVASVVENPVKYSPNNACISCVKIFGNFSLDICLFLTKNIEITDEIKIFHWDIVVCVEKSYHSTKNFKSFVIRNNFSMDLTPQVESKTYRYSTVISCCCYTVYKNRTSHLFDDILNHNGGI